jgi:hypothetical protein
MPGHDDLWFRIGDVKLISRHFNELLEGKRRKFERLDKWIHLVPCSGTESLRNMQSRQQSRLRRPARLSPRLGRIIPTELENNLEIQ